MKPGLTNTQQAQIEIENEVGDPIQVTVVGDTVWELQLQADEAANDNDKTITVTAGYEWQILWIWVEYAADGTAGNRQLQIDFRDDADDVIGQQRPSATQAANETRYYMLGPSLANVTAFYDTDYLQTPLPPTMFLEPGYDVRIFDNNNVSGNDDMVIQMMVARRAV